MNWKEFNRRFDPYRTLDAREVGRLYAERQGIAPWRRLLDDIATAPEPGHVRALLVGSRGSGKTTELKRLQAALGEDAGDFLPIYVDFAPALPQDAGTLPILAVIAAAVRAVADDWKAPPAKDDPLARALQAFGVAADWLPLAVNAAGAIASWLALSGEPTALTTLPWTELSRLAAAARTALGARLTDAGRPRAEALVAATQAEIARLGAAAGRQPVLLVDGLDKRPDMASVERGIADADLLLGLGLPLVLTGPVQLRLEPAFAGLTMPGSFQPLTLANLPVVHRAADTGEVGPHEPGIGVLLDLYRRRLRADPPLPDLLAEDDLRRLARASSGVVREFLLLLKLAGQASRLAGHARIEAGDVDQAMRERRHDLQASLDSESWAVLARVLRSRRLPAGETASELLLANVIACYPNRDVWFRPHELLVPSVAGEAGGTRAPTA